jgi:hypothetical protein
MPIIDYVAGRRTHIFECNAKICKGKGQNGRNVRRYLDTSDAKSTSNLRRHAKVCWGEEAVEAASQTKDVHAARDAMSKAKPKDGSITAVFERIGKTKITYSHRQHTKTESRYVPHKTLLFFSLFSIARRLFGGFLKACVPSALSKIEAFNPS